MNEQRSKATSASSAQAKAPGAAIAGSTTSDITPEQREQMIAEAAYFRYERRGFQGGDPQRDWLEAEVEIDQMLGGTLH